MTEDGTYPEGTVNHALPNRLRELAIKLKISVNKGKNQKKVKANQ